MTGAKPQHNLLSGHVPQFCDASAAIIFTPDERYLVQLRDDKPGIFYPGHWGLFGGGLEPGEDPAAAMVRELEEELELVVTPGAMRHFTRMAFELEPFGQAPCFRDFFEVETAEEACGRLKLGEGQKMELVPLAELLLDRPIVPYDSFALWMHHASRHGGQSGRHP